MEIQREVRDFKKRVKNAAFLLLAGFVIIRGTKIRDSKGRKVSITPCLLNSLSFPRKHF